MFRRGGWTVEGVHVLRSDVQRWMDTVGRRCPDGRTEAYIRDYRVPEKIARLKAAGTFERVIALEAAQLGCVIAGLGTPRRPLPLVTMVDEPSANEVDFIAADGSASNDPTASNEVLA